MIYHIFYPLKEYFSAFNVFRYSTFRSIYASLTAIVICFLIGYTIIKWLKKIHAEQPIRDDGPKTHKKKEGTPTMGGLIVLISVCLSTILWARLDNRFIILMLVSLVWFGGVGFLDDYLKLKEVVQKDLKLNTN